MLNAIFSIKQRIWSDERTTLQGWSDDLAYVSAAAAAAAAEDWANTALKETLHAALCRRTDTAW